MDRATEGRIAENEVRFREMNERRRQEGGKFHGSTGDTLTVMCECAFTTCTNEFELELDAYCDARSDPKRFVLLAGHELPEVEQVVHDLGDGRLVVEKFGDGANVAEGRP